MGKNETDYCEAFTPETTVGKRTWHTHGLGEGATMADNASSGQVRSPGSNFHVRGRMIMAYSSLSGRVIESKVFKPLTILEPLGV